MAKATKLPSGNWRVRVYIGKDSTGKAMYRSFTNPDRKKVLFEASLYQIEHREERTRMTFRKAMDEYISSKEMILSPSTVSGYLTIQKMLNLIHPTFCDIELDKLKAGNIQGCKI